MFCPNCGGQIAEGASFCSHCGQKAVPGGADGDKKFSDMSIGEIGKRSVDAVKKLPFDASQQDEAIVAVAGKSLKLSLVIRGVALFLCALFFFPLFSVSCSGTTINFNGIDSTIGKNVSAMGSSDRIDGNLLSIFLLLIPLALFLAFQLKKWLPFIRGKLFLTSASLSVAGIIAFGLFSAAVRKRAEENYAAARFSGAYYFSIVLYVLLAAVSVLCFFVGRTTHELPRDGDAPVSPE